MHPKTIARIAKPLKAAIGAHYRLLGDPWPGHEAYTEARRLSDEAERQAKYLIQHLSNRHDAVILASMIGCPGYINFR